MTSGIDCDVYHDRVEIKMIGEATITITKPARLPSPEWNRFWGMKHSRTPNAFPAFTQADAEANNRRRLENTTAP